MFETISDIHYLTSLYVRDIIKLAIEKLQLLLQTEESYALINSYQHYRHQLSEVCSTILFNQILLANYILASKVYSDMGEIPIS